MVDYTLATQIKPLDVATPLLQAEKMRALQVAQEKEQMDMRREELGSIARGLVPFVGKPEFGPAWAAAHDQMLERGLINPQQHGQLRSAPSPLILSQLIAQTTDPGTAIAERKMQLDKEQSDRAFAEQKRQFDVQQATLKEERDLKRQEQPWVIGPNGSLVPRLGGPADPAYIEKTTGAKDKTSEQIAERERAVRARGLDPKDPSMQSYILTGKMPREDQQPLTAVDKKEILEADEMVQTNQSAIDLLTQAKNVSPKANYGPFAKQRGYIESLGGSEAGLATVDLDNIVVGTALGQLKAIFGAAPTEGERKILLELQGSSSLPDAARQKIYDRAIALAQKRLEFNRQKAEGLRGKTYYKPKADGTAPAGSDPLGLF